MLMYCVKVEKVWEHQKYETIAWLIVGVVHDLILCVMKISIARIYDVGEADPRTPMGTGPLSVRREAEVAQRADRGGTRERFYPASGRTDA